MTKAQILGNTNNNIQQTFVVIRMFVKCETPEYMTTYAQSAKYRITKAVFTYLYGFLSSSVT